MASTSHIIAPVSGQIVAYFMDLPVRFTLHMNYRKTVRILSSLSKNELDDLGLSQASLTQAAHKAVYGV